MHPREVQAKMSMGTYQSFARLPFVVLVLRAEGPGPLVAGFFHQASLISSSLAMVEFSPKYLPQYFLAYVSQL
jgi:hypothetical protein